jgi:hypothetical protein
MSRPAISQKQLTSTIILSECSDGFWLYDKIRGMNLSMRAKTEENAFVDALTYYQNRLLKAEANYKSISEKVDLFIEQFKDDEEDD